MSARFSGRTFPPRGSGTVPSKAQGPVSREAGGECRTNSSSGCHRRSRPRQDGRACPPLYIKDETAEAASRTRGEPRRGGGGDRPAPSSGPLLENEEHRRQRLTNICGATAGVSRGQLPAGRPTGRRGAAEGSEDRGRRTPGSVSSPGWRERDGSGLGSAGRTDGQGFSTASRAARRQTCLPSLCQPGLRFPLGPSQRQRTCSP